jgi:uncharacterized protein (DUF111 family)
MVPDDGVEWCEQAGNLLFVEVDHLSGELLGDALEQLYAAGASNVHILSTLTKKGRPGNLIVIDVLPDKLDVVERVVVTELGVTGWHRMMTQHVHLRTEIVTRRLTILTPASRLQEEVRGKRLAGTGKTVRPEYRSCVALRDRLRTECSLCLPLYEVVRMVSVALEDQTETVIDLRNPAI